jgi:hypothetical protein
LNFHANVSGSSAGYTTPRKPACACGSLQGAGFIAARVAPPWCDVRTATAPGMLRRSSAAPSNQRFELFTVGARESAAVTALTRCPG